MLKMCVLFIFLTVLLSDFVERNVDPVGSQDAALSGVYSKLTVLQHASAFVLLCYLLFIKHLKIETKHMDINSFPPCWTWAVVTKSLKKLV